MDTSFPLQSPFINVSWIHSNIHPIISFFCIHANLLCKPAQQTQCTARLTQDISSIESTRSDPIQYRRAKPNNPLSFACPLPPTHTVYKQAGEIPGICRIGFLIMKGLITSVEWSRCMVWTAIHSKDKHCGERYFENEFAFLPYSR